MKNVVIVGKNSYIGASFNAYARNRFNIRTIDAKDGKWKAFDFSNVDTLLHCAGIAHAAQKKNMRDFYNEINCNLAVDVAKAAKVAGVRQFMFLSSMSVYGDAECEITAETKPNAIDFYGGSKLAAEKELQKLAELNFSICVLRPPMVYGYGCKGNFPRLVKLAQNLPVFPDVKNRRSMIYIDNLCEFLCRAIEENKSGIHFPQNAEYVNTTELVQIISGAYGKKIRTTQVFNPLIMVLTKNSKSFKKLFGNLVYVKTGDEANYNVVGFKDGVIAAVLGESINK